MTIIYPFLSYQLDQFFRSAVAASITLTPYLTACCLRPIHKSTMGDRCFICLDELTGDIDDVGVTSCCRQRAHKECQQRWIVDHFHCGYCRAPLGVLEPVSDLTLQRFRLVEWLLHQEPVCHRIATIEGVGSLVDETELLYAIEQCLGGRPYSIEREGIGCGGFQPGRLVRVTYASPVTEFVISTAPR